MLYSSLVWSRDGMRIIQMRYFLIQADKDTIERIKSETNPKNVDEFLAHLTFDRHISVEEVKPISLDI